MLRTVKACRWYHMGRSDEVRAVDDISLTIGKTQTAVLYGPSGSGKTTLLSLLGTIDRPTAGQVFLKDRDVTQFSDAELSRIRRTTVGFIFQGFHLFSRVPAWENVSYPLIPLGIRTKDRYARAGALLERLGLGDRLHHGPEELSGGEQQRVAIARALVNDPEILIADEPTSNIDADSVHKLLDILGKLRQEGKTLIVSSHDALFKDRGDILFNLDRGKLVGTHQAGKKQRESDPR